MNNRFVRILTAPDNISYVSCNKIVNRNTARHKFFIVVIILLIFWVKRDFCVKLHLTFQVKRVFFVSVFGWKSFLCQPHIAFSVIKTFCARPLWWWISMFALLTRAKSRFLLSQLRLECFTFLMSRLNF